MRLARNARRTGPAGMSPRQTVVLQVRLVGHATASKKKYDEALSREYFPKPMGSWSAPMTPYMQSLLLM